jgi:hypothetical protein
MINKMSGLIICFSFISFICTFSQVVERPNFGLKSHETLQITKIEIATDKTIVHLTIENRIEGGSFCADKNIFLIDPSGEKLRMTQASGIPVCPDSYTFENPGEVLQFTLEFPPLKPGTNWIDIIEECNENCFSFYGVVLNKNINGKIDDAFYYADNHEPSKALISFINIAEEVREKNFGIGGVLYVNIILLSKETGNSVRAAEWYKKLQSSEITGLTQYIKFLNNRGIRY